jgi:hypothetical protein
MAYRETPIWKDYFMKKLILVLVAVVVGLAIWRRNEFRSDADRASKAVSGAATSARNKMPSSSSDAADAVSDAASDAADAVADAASDAADAVADAADEASDKVDASS